MTVIKQEYCCVRPMRYMGIWPDVQGGHQHEWRCDRCGEKRRADASLAWALAPASVNGVALSG